MKIVRSSCTAALFVAACVASDKDAYVSKFGEYPSVTIFPKTLTATGNSKTEWKLDGAGESQSMQQFIYQTL